MGSGITAQAADNSQSRKEQPKAKEPESDSQGNILIPFPTEGIFLNELDALILRCGGLPALEGLSTEEFCEKYVKPLTAHHKISFVDSLKQEKSRNATVYISHSWKSSFIKLIQILKDYFRDSHDVVIWVDIFSVNQHIVRARTIDNDWWKRAFQPAIKKINQLLLVLNPWRDALPLRSTWCVNLPYFLQLLPSHFTLFSISNLVVRQVHPGTVLCY